MNFRRIHEFIINEVHRVGSERGHFNVFFAWIQEQMKICAIKSIENLCVANLRLMKHMSVATHDIGAVKILQRYVTLANSNIEIINLFG